MQYRLQSLLWLFIRHHAALLFYGAAIIHASNGRDLPTARASFPVYMLVSMRPMMGSSSPITLQQHPAVSSSVQQPPAAPSSLKQPPAASSSLQQPPAASSNLQRSPAAPSSLWRFPAASSDGLRGPPPMASGGLQGPHAKLAPKPPAASRQTRSNFF